MSLRACYLVLVVVLNCTLGNLEINSVALRVTASSILSPPPPPPLGCVSPKVTLIAFTH